jgi:hypothetical protein
VWAEKEVKLRRVIEHHRNEYNKSQMKLFYHLPTSASTYTKQPLLAIIIRQEP